MKEEDAYGRTLAFYSRCLSQMAYTKTTLTLSAGYSRTQALDFMGDLCAAFGIMASNTSWHDSFTVGGTASTTGVAGGEVRVARELITDATGYTYQYVYHMFIMLPSTNTEQQDIKDSIYYTTKMLRWNSSTHTADGTDGIDYPGTTSDADLQNWSTNELRSYAASMIVIRPAAALTIDVFTEAGECSFARMFTPDHSMIVGHVPSATSWRTVDWDLFSPPGFIAIDSDEDSGISQQNLRGGIVTAMPTTVVQGIRSVSESSSSTLAPAYSGWEGSSFGSETMISISARLAYGYGLYGHRLPQSNDAYSDSAYSSYKDIESYQGLRNIPVWPQFCSSLTLGPSLTVLGGVNQGAFLPAPGDSLVVSAGVEEYYVLSASTSAISASTSPFDWHCILARTV